VRNVIIYLLYFVFVEENKKEAAIDDYIPFMSLLDLPDKLKSYR